MGTRMSAVSELELLRKTQPLLDEGRNGAGYRFV